MKRQQSHREGWSDDDLGKLEAAHPEGLSTQQVVQLLAARGERISEATFRKYVQLGLLPRSVRVGRKGKHRGSQGLYPVTVVRQIDLIRRLMAQGYTIQEIQREFLFLRSDIEELRRQLEQVFGSIEGVVAKESGGDAGFEVVGRAVDDARQLGKELIEKLRAIDGRLTMRARMARAAV